jgi:hypothetical protein
VSYNPYNLAAGNTDVFGRIFYCYFLPLLEFYVCLIANVDGTSAYGPGFIPPQPASLVFVSADAFSVGQGVYFDVGLNEDGTILVPVNVRAA